jgi:hypothetical protein
VETRDLTVEEKGMSDIQVEFLPDERALLDRLHHYAGKQGGIVSASDTRLIREMKLEDEPQRFFSAKMRLVAGGVITLHLGRSGEALIRLNYPERPDVRSKRYAFIVVPLELVGEITARSRA